MLALSGCWSQIGFGPEHRRHNTVENVLTTENVGGLAQAWTVEVEVDGTASELITAQGRVFTRITGPDGVDVLAVDAATGDELWRVEVAAGQKLGVAVADGFLFLSRSTGSSNRPSPAPA